MYASYKGLNQEEKILLTKNKIELLVQIILSNGTGSSEDNTLKVVSVDDEYALMQILKHKGRNRNSIIKGTSSIDIWKITDHDGSSKDLYIEVFYNLSALNK